MGPDCNLAPPLYLNLKRPPAVVTGTLSPLISSSPPNTQTRTNETKMIFTFSSSSTSLFTSSTAPTTASGSTKTSCIVQYGVAGGAPWRSRSTCLHLRASKLRGLGEIDNRSFSRSASAAAATVSSSDSDQQDIQPSRTFLDARTAQDLLAGIQKEAEAGRLPVSVAKGMEGLYLNYRNAVLQSEHPKADEVILSNMAAVLDRVLMDVRDPFQFAPYHEAIREPFDYYLFGQNYIRPLVDFRSSYLGNASLFSEMETKLQQGENIILISNHQTEADPAVISLLLESTNPLIAENVIFIAGDRVITDPLCKPFSMGRNLLCVYSKKHMNDDPELVDMKKRANIKSLKEMAVLLRGGSKVIWIAPSGGRDRPNPDTKEWYPAPFDATSLVNMRRLAENAGVPGHVYPLSILCHDIMPPPPQVEKEIGEKRLISFHGVGVSVAPSIDYHDIASAFEDPEEAKMRYTELVYSSVCKQYNVLNSAIHGKQGLEASSPTTSLSQPWL